MNWILIILCVIVFLFFIYWLGLIAQKDILDLVKGVNRRQKSNKST